MNRTVENKEGLTFQNIETFTIIKCCTCDIPFGVPVSWKKKRRALRDVFHCPNGHRQHFTGKTENECLRERLIHAEANEKFHRSRASAAEKTAAAYKGLATKRKKKLNRVQEGVCPCCNRTFQNLARHMASKHPEH